MNTQQNELKPILKLTPKSESEGKKVCVDGGFIAVPKALMAKVAKFGFTKHQRSVIDAVFLTCLAFRKEMDWIANSQIVELTCIGFDNKASTAKQELVRMNVLVEKGKKIGFNMNLDEWGNGEFTESVNHLPKQSSIYRNGKKTFTETVKTDLPKQSNTKDIIKENIYITPLPPNGESACTENISQVSGVDENPVAEESIPKNTKAMAIDYEGVYEAWNEVFAGTPVPKLKVLNDERKRKIRKLAKALQSEFQNCSAKAFRDYFEDFLQQATAKPNSWLLGNNNRNWVADFDYLMQAKVFAKTVEEAL